MFPSFVIALLTIQTLLTSYWQLPLSMKWLPKDLALDPIVPWPVILLMAIILFFFTLGAYLKSGQTVSGSKNWVLIVLRSVGTLAILATLLQPSRRETIPPQNIQPLVLIGLDTSKSMKQIDADGQSRLERGKSILLDSGIVSPNGKISDPNWRLFEFSDDAKAVNQPLFRLTAQGNSTHFHRSIEKMLSTSFQPEEAKALILLTDGHDFELAGASKTGFNANNRHIPIYAIPLGKKGKVRDISVRLSNYLPYCYVNQKANIHVLIRSIGCDFEDIQIQLIRQEQIIQTKQLNTGEKQQIETQFEVVENETGQDNYEVRIVPLAGEDILTNNKITAYLNIIDHQIRILVLEGAPYWETTFLQRSLMRNDKLNVDVAVRYSPKKINLLQKDTNREAFHIPQTQDEWNQYDVIIFGKAVDRLINENQLKMVESFVMDRGGSLIFSRDNAFEKQGASNKFESLNWSTNKIQKLQLRISREGQNIPPLKIIANQEAGGNTMPSLISGKTLIGKKAMSTILAEALPVEETLCVPAIVHQPYGQGQIISFGVSGFWRWAFNAKSEGSFGVFDRFWDQMILWLAASQDATPTKNYSFRLSGANISLGEKIFFRLMARNPSSKLQAMPLTVYRERETLLNTTFKPVEGQEGSRWVLDYTPEQLGEYRAIASFPDGTKQESRFQVYSENLEETDVTADVNYLKQISEISGGKLLAPDGLKPLIQALKSQALPSQPKIRLASLWDNHLYFYLLVFCLGLDWFLRRRWGLC